MLIILCLLGLALTFPQGEQEYVYPERLHPTRLRRDLSSKTGDGNHDDEVSYRIKSKDNDYILDLKKAEKNLQNQNISICLVPCVTPDYLTSVEKTTNSDGLGKIHPGSILLRTYDDEGNPVHDNHKPEDCHYHGQVRGVKDSNVYISTCNGLTGSLDDGKRQLDIEPKGKDGMHVLYDIKHDLRKINTLLKKQPEIYESDSVEMKDTDKDVNQEYEEKNSKRELSDLDKFSLINVKPQYVKYLPTTKTRYVEMFITADDGLYNKYNKDVDLVIERVLNALSQVDKAYQAINIRLVVVAVEVWTNGPRYERKQTGGADLSAFTAYVNDVIKKTSEFKNIRIDNSHLLSHYYWTDAAGMAYVGGLCKSSSNAVDAWSFDSIRGPTVTIGHELGHNFHFPHDDYTKCTCLTARGCFMGGTKSSLPGFSDCNMKLIQTKTLPCINDKPATAVHSICGNGVKEPGEECDCGTPENCAKNGDNCCEPHGCKLHAHVQCSHIEHPSCCSKQCYFSKERTLCREPNNECDVPEYCTGDSAICPKDKTVYNGHPCGDSTKMLLGPRGRKTQDELFDPPIFARYVKIIPKQWKKDGHACTKLDLYGCPKDQDASVIPTGIRTDRLYYLYYLLCISPKVSDTFKDCNEIQDGAKLIYFQAPHEDCNIEHMLFIHKSDGSMIHKCTGMKVCRDTSNHLVLSKQCEDDKNKYERTAEKSLKLKGTRQCWDSKDGWPNSGDEVKLRESCDDTKYYRSKLTFLSQDCETNLGLGNYKLPDSSISASSVYNSKYNTSKIRLDQKGWCPLSKTEESWVKIDLLKEYKVAKLVMKDTYWDWINGYHLHYSPDGVVWHKFHGNGEGTKSTANSQCYEGSCISTYDQQCKTLWNSDAKKADDKCWIELNTKANGFGTCSPSSNTTCSTGNMFCGQLQCTAGEEKPYFVDYGTQYQQISLNDKTCSGAMITSSEQVGLGMVEDGTRCGDGKLCLNQKCKTYAEHGFPSCPKNSAGQVCNGKGVCRSDGTCLCDGNFSPDDGCMSERAPVNGGFSDWSEFTPCSHACGSGKQSRYRLCNQPVPKYGGDNCDGKLVDERECNAEACPIEGSCKALQANLVRNNKPLINGIYKVKPSTSVELNVYCDMTNFNGGWTLIVASDTNSWTKDNLLDRNSNKPSLNEDYSILKYANLFKENYLIGDSNFEYRLEANGAGTWGGIWSAPNRYSLSSTSKYQTDVNLVIQFNDTHNIRRWSPGSDGVDNRVPYIVDHKLTTSAKGTDNKPLGTITDNVAGLHPSRWIKGNLLLEFPEHIWYWIREGNYKHPRSCLEIRDRGFRDNINYSNGVFEIEPVKGTIVDTYCDFTRHGGGWTLVAKSTSQSEWTKENAGKRNSKDASKAEFSIFSYIDEMKQLDVAEISFDYMIEANGDNENGGIFSYSTEPSLLTCPSKGFKPKLLKKFGDWNEETESLAKFAPYITSSNGVFVKAGSADTSDSNGAIIKSKVSSGKYLSSLENPTSIKLWIREGGSRQSCNDIKVHGLHKGKTGYKDGFYMLQNSQTVYCDMTSTRNEGWTLLVTSADSGWTREQVLSHNKDKPSLDENYSILKQGNNIKALSNGKTFKYMLDAAERKHFGGIWEAPIEYSLTSEKKQLSSRLRKFGDWEDTWWKMVSSQVPYLGRISKGRAMLTTAKHDDYYESGTICAGDSKGYRPARWVDTNSSPGRIWYWLNENDCDSDYKKVDGGLSLWSLWTPCAAYCGSGTRTRRRMCNLPKPRCGGKDCDPNAKLSEEESCEGPCKETRITDPSNDYCLEPSEGGCNPADKTVLVYRQTSSKCQDDSSKFAFDPDRGILYHACSKKRVCAMDGKLEGGNKIVIDSNCPKMTYWGFSRNMFKSVQLGDYFCLDPYGGNKNDGTHVGLWSGCKAAKRQLIFPSADPGKVTAEYYSEMTSFIVQSLLDRTDFKQKDPTQIGTLDNMVSAKNVDDNFGYRLAAYFIAPMSGNHIFTVSCDAKCNVYFKHGPNIDRTNYKIIELKSWTSRFQFDKYPDQQKSKEIFLEVGKKYYLEGLFVAQSGGDHIEIGVYLPDGSSLLPITSYYLSADAN